MNRLLILSILIILSSTISGQVHTIEDKGSDQYKLVWVQPELPMVCGKNEKLELGIELPHRIDSLIQNFIAKKAGDKINPFNPDDIDIKAVFEHTDLNQQKHSMRQYGFFYVEFERKAIDWKKQENDYPFRIRISPTHIGKWTGSVSIQVKNEALWQSEIFEFDVIESNLKGYVGIGKNKYFFQQDSSAFFPVGQNVVWPEEFESDAWRSKTIGPQGYRNYHNELQMLADDGANYYRLMVAPWTLDIEFEELGNYYDRMNIAWEIDKIIEHSAALGLYIHFNLSIHCTLENTNTYAMWPWDWTAGSSELYLDGPCKNTDKDKGYCYPQELGLKTSLDFLTDSAAIHHYQNRYRYYISRYGYSTNITLFELMSEINNIGGVRKLYWDQSKNDGKGACVCERIESELWIDSLYPGAINYWQEKMSTYIKQELGHKEHLLSVSYAGVPNIKGGDSSYWCDNIDVITYNFYSTREDQSAVQRGRDIYKSIEKPFLYGEIGGSHQPLYYCADYNYLIKTAYSSIFSGSASIALTWADQHNAHKQWHHYGKIKNFLGPIDFSQPGWDYDNESRVDDKAEMLFMYNHEQGRYIGMLYNKTYNYHTIKSNPCSDEPALFTKEMYIAQNVSPERFGKALKLRGLERGQKYVVVWYDMIGETVLDTQYVKPDIFRNIRLEYPTLTIDSGNILPFVGFKCFKIESPSFDSIDIANQVKTYLPNEILLSDLATNQIVDLDQFKELSDQQTRITLNATWDTISIRTRMDLQGASMYILNDKGTPLYKHFFEKKQYQVGFEEALKGRITVVIIKDNYMRLVHFDAM
jgi:hypothetical protein